MKEKLLHIILLAIIALCVPDRLRAWGETTSYVLNASAEKTVKTGITSFSGETSEVFQLSGPGTTLTFEAKKSSALSASNFFAQVSTDNQNWTDLNTDALNLSTSYKSFSFTINNLDVRYFRFEAKVGATGTKTFRNVKITRATTLSTSTTELDFGTITNRNTATLNALIDYNNTTYDQQVTGTSTDPNFTVIPTTVSATGESQEIPVAFIPTSAGSHSGTVTLTMNGKTVTFQVKGVGKTTYYTKAIASATEGGSAYVSFNSFDAATNSSATKNSGVTTESKASATAYFHAVPHQRYAFLGWKQNLSDAAFASTDMDFQTTYDYNSESSSSPTTVTYYAVFELKPNVITLEPTTSEYDLDLYETVTLHRTLRQGYNTIALPFATTVQELTRRTSDDDWVAQLSAVTYNQHDGFTLFFQKVASGRIHAFEPYILHLGEQVTDPSWTDIELTAATPVTITPAAGYSPAVSPSGTSSYADWQMTSNFTAGFSMSGLLGIVNSAGALQRGSSTATLNAFTAYITPAPEAAGVKVRSAFTDEQGTTTYVSGLPASSASTSSPLYDLSGRRITSPSQPLSSGLYIQRNRKIIVRH